MQKILQSKTFMIYFLIFTGKIAKNPDLQYSLGEKNKNKKKPACLLLEISLC
jgi:hypothetical protein